MKEGFSAMDKITNLFYFNLGKTTAIFYILRFSEQVVGHRDLKRNRRTSNNGKMMTDQQPEPFRQKACRPALLVA